MGDAPGDVIVLDSSDESEAGSVVWIDATDGSSEDEAAAPLPAPPNPVAVNNGPGVGDEGTTEFGSGIRPVVGVYALSDNSDEGMSEPDVPNPINVEPIPVPANLAQLAIVDIPEAVKAKIPKPKRRRVQRKDDSDTDSSGDEAFSAAFTGRRK